MSSSNVGGRSGTRGAGAGRRVAALHRQGDMFRLVVAEKGAGGAGAGSGGGPVRIVEAKSFAAGDVSSVRAAVEQLGVEKLVRVLPACACVSRGVEVPDAPEAELGAALALLAEAHLPTGVPAHRRAWGVIPGPATDGHRAALLLGWAGEAEEAIVPEIETWTSELASLASLVEPKKSTLAVYADRDSGSVAVLAWNGTRSSVRAMRESSVSAAEWDGSIARLVEDSAVRFGIDAEVLALGGGTASGGRATSLWLDESTRARASRSAGAGDGAWLRDYGVAAGAASLALGVTPASARLVEMTASPRIAVRSRLERAVAWMSEPARAWKIAAASLALVLLLPLGTAWARKAMLQGKARAVEAQQAGKSADELDMRLAMYRELDKRRLPMAKVIADIAGCMPAGVSLDSLQVIASDKRLAIRGKAPDRSTLTAFVSKLNASGVFGDCDFSRADAKDDSVEFDVSGKVTGPMVEARGVEDWTKVPLAVKLYGEEARKPRLSAETKPEKKPAAAKRGSGGKSGAGRDVFDARPAAKPADPVPPALTEAAIKALDRTSGSKELAARLKARSRSDIDAATKDRLKEELDKIRAHLRGLQDSAKGGT